MRVKKYGLELSNDMPVLAEEYIVEVHEEKELNSPKKIVLFMNDSFCLNRKAEEYAFVLAFTTRGKPIAVFEISHGTVNETVVSPREIMMRLLLCGAVQFVLVHNHPSGNTEPSEADKEITGRMKGTGELLGIFLLDHIIIADDKFCSFREEGITPF